MLTAKFPTFLFRSGQVNGGVRRAAEKNIPWYRRQTVDEQDFHRLATVATGKLPPAARLNVIP